MKSSANTVTIISRYDSATLDGLTCSWSTITDEGEKSSTGSIEIPSGVQPGSTVELTIPEITLGDRETLLNLSFALKENTTWAKSGHEVALVQVPLKENAAVTLPQAQKDEKPVEITKTNSNLVITSASSEWTMSLASGSLTSWLKNKTQLIAEPLKPSFFRAPTDNDFPQDGRDWLDRYLQHARIHTSRATWETSSSSGTASVTLTQRYGPKVLSWSLDLTTTLTFSPSGTLSYHVSGVPSGQNLPKTLPRIGIDLGLPSSFQKVQWFGRGPAESYSDMKLSQPVALNAVDRVDELWASPDYPQECSNRTDTRWLKIADGSGAGLTAQFYTPADESKQHLFDFMASHYDVQDIFEAKHPHELEEKKKEHVILRLDAKHHGLGTGSCGPKTLDEYALKTEPFEFGIVLF